MVPFPESQGVFKLLEYSCTAESKCYFIITNVFYFSLSYWKKKKKSSESQKFLSHYRAQDCEDFIFTE